MISLMPKNQDGSTMYDIISYSVGSRNDTYIIAHPPRGYPSSDDTPTAERN